MSGDRSALVFAAGQSPIVVIGGRYYVEEPDPAERAARETPSPPAEVDPFAGWDLAAIAERFQGRTWVAHGRWDDPVQAWTFHGSSIAAIVGGTNKTLAWAVRSPCALTVSEHTLEATFETDVYFGWDGDDLHASSGPMGWRDNGVIAVCSDRGTVIQRDGRCSVWLKVLSSPWASSQATCAENHTAFGVQGDFGTLDLAFRGDALVNDHYDADGATSAVEDLASARVAIAR